MKAVKKKTKKSVYSMFYPLKIMAFGYSQEITVHSCQYHRTDSFQYFCC